jgi:hypothetical protein
MSLAVPVTVIGEPFCSDAPEAGLVTVEVGGVVSVDLVAGDRPDCSVVG